MTEDEKAKRRRSVGRDSALTVLAGPLKFVVPTVAYVFLYPIMLSRTGMEVLGLWSIIGAIIAFIGVADIGFSQLLTREVGADAVKSDIERAHADYISAQRAYIFIFLALCAVFFFGRTHVLAFFGGVYPQGALTASIVVVFAGAVIQLIGKLDAAILSAYQDNYVIQIVTATVPLFTFSSAIIGALIYRPIEGLAIGTVISAIATVTVFRLRLRRHHAQWVLSRQPQTLGETASRLSGLMKRGWYLYGSSVGLLIRGPVFRFVIASALGLGAAALFDIAMRLTQTVRDLVASGFNVLYPSFSYFHRNRDKESIIELMKVSLMVLMTFGAVSLGVLTAVSGELLTLWLGESPAELVDATRILALWQVMTLANVPFWFLLHATHHEKVAAASVWAHTAAVILVLPLSEVFGFSLTGFIVYWTLTSIVTQCLIYFYVQSKLKLLWDVVLSPRVMALLGMVLVFFLWSLYLPAGSLVLTIVYAASGALVFFAGSAFVVGKPVYQFIRSTMA